MKNEFDDDCMELFRVRLKYYRYKLNMTQAQLAEEVDVSEHYIRLIENGYSVPSTNLFQAICKALDVPAYNLLQSSNDAMRFRKPQLYEKLKSMDEARLNSLLDTLFK